MNETTSNTDSSSSYVLGTSGTGQTITIPNRVWTTGTDSYGTFTTADFGIDRQRTAEITTLFELFAHGLYGKYVNKTIKNIDTMQVDEYDNLRFLTLKAMYYIETEWRRYGGK